MQTGEQRDAQVRPVTSTILLATSPEKTETSYGLLESILESSDDAIVSSDLSGIITSWNSGAQIIFGYAARETVGTSIDRLIPLDRRHEMREILGKIKRGELVKRYETLRQTKGGRLIDVSVNASPIKVGNRVVGALKVSRDITEEKSLARALSASEMRYRRLFETSNDGILILHAETGVVVEVNPFLIAMLGYPHDEFVGKAIWELGPLKDVLANEDNFTELKEKGYLRYDNLPLETADGQRIEVEFISNVYLVDDRQVIQCNVRDVTERRRTEQALRASEAHFRFLNALSDATRSLVSPLDIIATTLRMLGQHLRASRCTFADVDEAVEQFSISHDYVDGCASVAGKYQSTILGTQAIAALRFGQTVTIANTDLELSSCEGAGIFSVMGVKAMITCPLEGETGLRGIMAVHQTTPREWTQGEIAIVQEVAHRCWGALERSEAANVVKQMNVDLEHRVIARTRELEETNKELEAFSYSVSHDLRAPLRAVDGFAQAVLEDYGAQLPGDAQRYLQTVRQGTQKMGTLIDDLLTFARLGRAPLNKRMINTRDLVQHAMDDLGGIIASRRHELHIGNLTDCLGDPSLLRQVWINLISNALKFTHGREGAMIEIGCEAGPQGSIFFTRDNGKGFDMRYADKLFGVFQRLHRAEDFEGTGVGLAIVQRIVHRHGGQVWAAGEIDRGAMFSFTLEAPAAP